MLTSIKEKNCLQVPQLEPRTILYTENIQIVAEMWIKMHLKDLKQCLQNIFLKMKKRNVILYVCKVQYG